MLLIDMDGDGDGDMVLMGGDVPPPVAGDGLVPMFIGPPRPMLWCTATHQVHTSPCTGPAT